VYVDYVPIRNRRTNKVNPWPRVRLVGVSFENLARRTVEQTGEEPMPIAEVDMSKSVPEKDVSVLVPWKMEGVLI
jgi:hypothetical protein